MLHQVRLALNGRIPPVAKSAYLKLREFNAAQRALPDFLIVGAMKAGTTSLFNYICQHPQVVGSVPKEIFYFSAQFNSGELWYRRHFPRESMLEAAHSIAGEATPTYLYSAAAPERAASVVPDAKLIVVLREPAERAVSHYYHQCRFNRENRPINDVLSSEAIQQWEEGKCPDFKAKYYFQWGNYASALRNWLNFYPKSQLLLIDSEDLFANPQMSFNQCCDFLEIPHHDLPHITAFNANQAKAQKPQLFADLKAAFAQQNQSLCELGFKADWC